jgi:hypothetical protein
VCPTARPCETATGTILRELALRYGIPLRWHSGFQFPVHDVPDDFRGPEMPLLARRIAGKDGTLNAAVIGTAEASLREQPDSWRDWGSQEIALQHLKQLWHVLVHYGLPAVVAARSDIQTGRRRGLARTRVAGRAGD